jgi:hypothetical protein
MMNVKEMMTKKHNFAFLNSIKQKGRADHQSACLQREIII